MLKYNVDILQLGPEVYAMLQNQMLILFNKNAPAELRDYCVITGESELKGPLEVGDKIKIEDKTFTVTAIGDAVNENLHSMGHVTLNFDGQKEPKLPGQIHLSPVFDGNLLGKGKITIK